MTCRDDSRIIRIVHPICCGLDVHKESVSACVIFPDDKGEEQYDVEVFGTFTDDLMRLQDWLAEHNCPVVAMESTGVYWRPVHNVQQERHHYPSEMLTTAYSVIHQHRWNHRPSYSLPVYSVIHDATCISLGRDGAVFVRTDAH